MTRNMWTTVVSNILLVMTWADFLSAGNVSSLALDPRISKFKVDIHHVFQGARVRMKRQLEESDPLIHKLKFGKVTQVDLPYLSELSLSFWLSIESKNQVLIGTTEGRLILFEMLDEEKNALTVAISDGGEMPVKARAFSYNDEQWFVVLHNPGSKYHIQLYQRVGRGLEKRQTIDLAGFSDMELIAVKGMYYLVVATYSTATNQGYSYHASVTLYYWAQTQFDAIASRVTYGARSLDCWTFDGSLYIAVGQEINDEGNMAVGSPIYLYNSKEEDKLVLWEMLATYGPVKVRHFYVAENRYLIFIGRKEAVIYWWSSGQFLEWQTLQGTEYASDVSVLSLRDEVAIVIALREEALIYTLDSSGYYVISFSMSFKGSNLRSLQFMFSRNTYYALALFAESQAQSTWRLELESHYLPSVDSLDSLQQCLLDTQQIVAERQTELEAIGSDMMRVWRRGSNQTVTSKVIIKGRISSKESKVRDVIVLKLTNIPHTSFSSVIAALTEHRSSLEDATKEFEGVVLKSERQFIRGMKHFKDHVYVPSLRMESTDNDININDVRISRLKNYALRKTGNQIVPNTAVISRIQAGTVNAGVVNGIATNDLLLLHGRQFVTGSLTFSDVSANSVSATAINSIPIEDIVTTTTSQIVQDLKTFSYLNSNFINVQGTTNEVDLGNIHKKIATTDNYNEFLGHLAFQNPLTVNGSIFLTSKLNKVVDISSLVSQSVNRDSQQDLTGFYAFKSGQVVNGDLLVTDSINGVSMDNLLTLDSNQKIYADIVFTEPLSVSRDVFVDAINGMNIGKQAVQKLLPRQFISGRKIFTEDIRADFVDMSDYVTLDGVDPSFLVQDIVQHRQGVVNHTSTVFKDVQVLGDLTALSGINGYSVLDLLSSVWLKSTEQHISVPVGAKFLHFKNDLQTNNVNKLDLENDFVSSYGDDVIVSPKSFHSVTVLKSLKTTGGVTVNGIDPKSLKAELDHYIDEYTIHGRKNLGSLEVFGNLNVRILNGLGMDDIMYPEAHQIVYGPVEFPAEVTSIVGNVQANSVSFGFINGINLNDFYRRAVTLTYPSMPISNKHFEHLKATNLSLPSGSKLGGVDLQEMTQRVVLLNVPQFITAPKSFASEVYFAKLISTSALNGLLLSSYLSKIVLTDEVSKISNKKFLTDVRAPTVFVAGTINGINLQDMATNVFYKSEDNEIAKLFTFKGDIDVGDLSSSIIDGVQWHDLIFLQNDEVLEAGWFLPSIHVDEDVFITGLLNGCDLSQIASSVYTNKTTQVINKRVNVNTIVILGNLKVKNQINKIQLEVLQDFITTTEDQIITSDVVIEAGLAVDNLVLSDLVDSTDIAYILKDAVRHSIPQEIRGHKEFKENVNVAALAGGDLFISRIDGIDFEELKETAVWKKGYQQIDGDKIFPTLSMSVVTISGYVNGLKLPQDVVRTDVSEHIAHPTYFLSDVYVPKDLVVHGLIDGVDINILVQHRVTLSTEQNVTAHLLFYDDTKIHGELTIDGTINDIVLELVAKVKSVHPLQGYKVFTEFYVAGPCSASMVNGYNVSQLDSNILRFNRSDYINEIQTFEKTIHATNSMYAEWINGISLRWLRDAFVSMINNLRPVLEYLEDLSSSLQHQLTHQLSATQDQVSKFAYFVLHQEINVGPTSKILRGYDLLDDKFSHSLVMWTKQKHCIFMEMCCHLDFSYWLRVTKSGFVMVEAAAESGRYYPIPNPTPGLGSKDFFIWTNSTDAQPNLCGVKNTRMFFASYTTDNLLKVFMDLENAPQLSDIKSFKKGYLYAVAAFYFDSKNEEYGSTVVFAYDETGQWFEYEVLPSFGVLSLDVVSYTRDFREDILLALGSGMDISPVSYSTVYKWNNINRGFEILQNIPSRYVASTLWIKKGKDLLLSLANVEVWPKKATECSEMSSGGQIEIYLYKEKLEWIQSIPIEGVISMASFSSDGDAYLAAASSLQQTVYIFEWRGYSGFVQIQSISADAQHLNVYSLDDDIYMTIASASSSSKILKMIRKGKEFSSTKYIDQRPLYQKDEVPDSSKVVSGC